MKYSDCSFSRYALISIAFLVSYSSFAQRNYSDIKQYYFKPITEKVLPGLSTDISSEYGCNKGILEADIIGDIAIASELYQNGCYTDGKYNHKNYPATLGEIVDAQGVKLFDAYQISGPKDLASEFLGSKHMLHMRFSSTEDHVIYQLEGGIVRKVTEISKDKVSPNMFVKLAIPVSELENAIILFSAPKTQSVSAFHALTDDVEGARLITNEIASITKTRYPISGDVFDNTVGYRAGPASHANKYGDARRFFTTFSDPAINVLWQDVTSGDITMTSMSTENQKYSSTPMPTVEGRLAGATSFKDTWYYMIFSTDNKKVGWLISASKKGKLIKKESLNLTRDGLNVFEYDSAESVSMVYSEGVLGTIISRKMNKHTDGLNHQGAIAVTFNAKTLKIIKNFGQTSSHSFDNFLYASSDGGFYGMDLADNYPRGINVHRIDDNLKSQLVYTFKTAHGEDPISPARYRYPKYEEISVGDKVYYQWSNDNATYTELGSMIEWDDSYDIYFVGEPDQNGKAIDNARAQGDLTDPRDVGMVKIKKNFYDGSDFVLSKGVSETSGFYSFQGTWFDQSHEGLNWLVDYQNKDLENASRLKAVRVQKDVYLFWEKWTSNSYLTTYMMKVNDQGKPISDALDLGPHLRIAKSDDPLVIDNRIIFVMGNRIDQVLELVEAWVK
ncbi:MAG: hypothetical protein JXR10_08620 [Cyclobacteriaceae bacterium]